jgi:hypothetical protein
LATGTEARNSAVAFARQALGKHIVKKRKVPGVKPASVKPCRKRMMPNVTGPFANADNTANATLGDRDPCDQDPRTEALQYQVAGYYSNE